MHSSADQKEQLEKIAAAFRVAMVKAAPHFAQFKAAMTNAALALQKGMSEFQKEWAEVLKNVEMPEPKVPDARPPIKRCNMTHNPDPDRDMDHMWYDREARKWYWCDIGE